MAGVGLRSETEFDKDNSERAKRNLDKDIHAMQVDAGPDRPAKEKPVETTPQVTKKTRTKGEEAAEATKAGGAAAASSDPQNIPIGTPNTNPRPRRGRSRERSAERAGRTAPVSASVAAEATEAARSAAPSEGWYTKHQKQLANQGQTVVSMDMLQKCLQVAQDSQSEIEKKLDKTIRQTKENTERIKALTKQAVYLLTEKRHTEDESSAEQYDTMGVPKSATQEDKTAFVTYILQEIGLTRASVQKVDVMEAAIGQEIRRMNFKDCPSKNKMNMFFRDPKNWGLEFWGANNQTWKGFEVWGRWTEGAVGKIIRDSVNTILRALIEAMGKDAVWANDRCSIDYRMSGTYEKADRTPRVLIIYSEEDADPKIYIYTNPPDDMTMDEWVKIIEKHFTEYYDRKLGGVRNRVQVQQFQEHVTIWRIDSLLSVEATGT